jgi:AAA15 family ATPase/GTPase
MKKSIFKEESLNRINYIDDNPNIKKVFTTKKLNHYVGVIRVEYDNGKQGANPVIDCRGFVSVISQLAKKITTNTGNEKIIVAEIQTVIKTLRNILFFDPEPALIEVYSRINDYEMKPNGSNLPAVLYHLYKKQNKKEAILDIMRSLPENEFKDISFSETEIGDVMFKVKEKVGKNNYDIEAEKLSCGTLRALAIVSALLQGEEGTMIIIEEVDNGIHPSRASKLIDTLITTHNTALLNAVNKDNLLGAVNLFL